ncbi:MFS transporter [Endozoicomonas acroporae]|uniref:MFS transporter n=1 Tax=Endozoicomonas acroporae TaxID=1701104 RepID=UPI0013D401A8|nr:MFS transporter [Endozoicomonas acroporae]
MATSSISLRGIIICSIAALFCSYQFMLQGAPSVMVPQLMSAFDLDVADIGWLTSSFLCFYLLFQVPGGYLADHCNARLLLVVCCVFMAIGCYWFSVSETLLSASASRAFMGVMTSPVIVVCMNLASRWFPERYFPTLAGAIEAFGLAGGGLGPLILPNLMEAYGWQGAMQAAAIFGAVLAALIAVFVQSTPPVSVSDARLHDVTCGGGSEADPSEKTPFDRASLILCCLYGFGLFAVITSFAGLWGIPFFYERFPGEQEAVADMVALIFVGAAIGAPLLGWLACLVGSMRKVMVVCAIASPVLFSLLIFCPCSMMLMAMICFMAGISSVGYMLAFSVVKSISPPERIGVLLAITNGSMLLAGPVMQLIIGFILEGLGHDGLGALSIEDYQLAFVPLLLCQLMALIVAICLKKQ